MPNDINELDVTDAGLKGIFGDRFHDETERKPVGAESKKASTTANEKKTEQKPKDKPVEDIWCPAKPEPNWMDKLIACTKHVFLFGALNLLIFYWQQKGLVAESVALPCMMVCAVLAGWGAARIGVRK